MYLSESGPSQSGASKSGPSILHLQFLHLLFMLVSVHFFINLFVQVYIQE